MPTNSSANVFLCSCTSELIGLTGLDPASCRAFVNDFAPAMLHLAARGIRPERAVRDGVLVIWAATLAGEDAALRNGRTCRKSELVGREICRAVLGRSDIEPRLARLARTAIAHAAKARPTS